MGGTGRRHLAHAHTRFLRIALFAAVGQKAQAHAGGFVGLWADELDVGYVNGHFLGEPASLLVAATGAHVLVDPVDALNQDLAFPGMNAQDPATLAAIIAADHFDNVVFANVHDLASLYKTCLRTIGSYLRNSMRAVELRRLRSVK